MMTRVVAPILRPIGINLRIAGIFRRWNGERGRDLGRRDSKLLWHHGLCDQHPEPPEQFHDNAR